MSRLFWLVSQILRLSPLPPAGAKVAQRNGGNMSIGVDNYLGMMPVAETAAQTAAGMRYDEKITHEAGRSAGHWQRSQQIARMLRARAGRVEHDPAYPAGLWVAVELRRLAEEIEGT
jgi:hypothetical protein